MNLKIIDLNLQLHLPGANVLMDSTVVQINKF